MSFISMSGRKPTKLEATITVYCDTETKQNTNIHSTMVKRFVHIEPCNYLKPLSHWHATSLRLVCKSIRQTVAICRETFAWDCKVLACIANWSRMVHKSFKHVILFCATKILQKLIAKSLHVAPTRGQP